MNVLCHACSRTFQITREELENEQVRCLHCQSDFIEYLFPIPSRSQSNTSANSNPLSTSTRRRSFTRSSVFVFPDSVSIRVSTNRGNNRGNANGSAGVSVGSVGGGGDSLTQLPISATTASNFRGIPFENIITGININDSPFDFAIHHIMGQLEQLEQPMRSPTDRQVLENLPRKKFGQIKDSLIFKNNNCNGEVDSCVVCHEAYKDNDDIIELPCKHVFHETCIVPWLEGHNTCPVCRHTLPLASSNNNNVNNSNNSSNENTEGNHVGRRLFRRAIRRRQDNPQNNENDNNEHELRERMEGAQRQLESLQIRLADQMAEQNRLREQIRELQVERTTIRSQFSSLQNQGRDIVRR